MTTLRDILTYVAAKASQPTPFHELRNRFNGDLTGLRVGLDRGLLELRLQCYALTPAGAAFLAKTIDTIVVVEKECSECRATKPASEFWRHHASADGLFDYCAACGNLKKRIAMEKRRQARERVLAASQRLTEHARAWDQAVALLAASWAGIMECDEVIRLAAQDVGSDNDSGRMHARTTFPRAAFVLNLALSEVKFPQIAPLLREVNFPPRLADYIGATPHADYLGGDKEREINGEETPTKVAGTPEGLQEQDPDRATGHDSRRAGSGRGAGVPTGKGKVRKARGVPASRRAVLA